MKIDEEILMAYADGELDTAARTTVETALREDPALAARVAAHRTLREQLSSAFASELDEPVPPHLLAAARGEPRITVARLDDARKRVHSAPRTNWSWPQWSAMAASVVFGVVIGQLTLRAPADDFYSNESGAIVAAGQLDHALTAALANDGSDHVKIGVSFRDRAGVYCRSFARLGEVSVTGLACRDGNTWRVDILERGAMQAEMGPGFRTAGSMVSPAVAAVIAARAEGDMLDRDAERAARERGWQ